MEVMLVLIVDDEVVNDYNNDDDDDRNVDRNDDFDDDNDDHSFHESSIYLRHWTHHGTIATHSHYQGTFVYIVSDW